MLFRVVSQRFLHEGPQKGPHGLRQTLFERTLPRRNFSISSNNRSLSLACMARRFLCSAACVMAHLAVCHDQRTAAIPM